MRLAAVLCALLLVVSPAAPAAAQDTATLPAPPPATAPAPAAPAVTAQGWVLYDPHDGRVLAGDDERVSRRMASITKIMTALLALEAGVLEDVVTVSATAAEADAEPGAATLNLAAGQQVPMRALLAGLLLHSGNDAAAAVAEHVAGSQEAFVARMNGRAAELGLTDTHFVDASGLTDDPAHSASPRDLAVLAATAMDHPYFAELVASPSVTVPGLGRIENRNALLGTYAGATGVKTGFTSLAGLCLVASATRDGRTLYAVVLGSGVDPARTQHFTDAAALLDYGFQAWRRAQPVDEGQVVTHYRWAGSAVPLVADRSLGRTVAPTSDVVWRTVLDPEVPPTLPQGADVGDVVLLVDGERVEVADLLTASAVSPPPGRPPDAAIGAAVQDALRGFSRLLTVDRSA